MEGVLAALWSPLELSAIPLRAAVERFQKAQRNLLKITCTVDVGKLQLWEKGNVWTGAINVFYIQQDVAGKELDKAQNALDIHFTREIYDGYLKSGMSMDQYVEPKAGLATLRVILIDRSLGTVGSLIIPIGDVH